MSLLLAQAFMNRDFMLNFYFENFDTDHPGFSNEISEICKVSVEIRLERCKKAIEDIKYLAKQTMTALHGALQGSYKFDMASRAMLFFQLDGTPIINEDTQIFNMLLKEKQLTVHAVFAEQQDLLIEDGLFDQKWEEVENNITHNTCDVLSHYTFSHMYHEMSSNNSLPYDM